MPLNWRSASALGNVKQPVWEFPRNPWGSQLPVEPWEKGPLVVAGLYRAWLKLPSYVGYDNNPCIHSLKRLQFTASLPLKIRQTDPQAEMSSSNPTIPFLLGEKYVSLPQGQGPRHFSDDDFLDFPTWGMAMHKKNNERFFTRPVVTRCAWATNFQFSKSNKGNSFSRTATKVTKNIDNPTGNATLLIHLLKSNPFNFTWRNLLQNVIFQVCLWSHPFS